MHSKGKVTDIDEYAAMPIYMTWLKESPCDLELYQESESSQHIVLSAGTRKYLESVPKRNRKQYRWGWKSTQSVLKLDELFTQFSGMLYVHVVRNPFDMASAFENLPARSREFAAIHGGYTPAADIMTKRCGMLVAGRQSALCTVSPRSMKDLAECSAYPCEPRLSKYKVGISSSSAAKQCLMLQHWAEVNAAVHTFGRRCLSPVSGRYLLWHGEDLFGLRGEGLRRAHIAKVADALHFAPAKVLAAFSNSTNSSKLIMSSHHRTRSLGATEQFRRRLIFGKFKKSAMNVERGMACAEQAVPGVLESFGYDFYAGEGLHRERAPSGVGEFDLEQLVTEPAFGPQLLLAPSGMVERVIGAGSDTLLFAAGFAALAFTACCTANKRRRQRHAVIERGGVVENDNDVQDFQPRARVVLCRWLNACLVATVLVPVSAGVIYLSYLSFLYIAVPVLDEGMGYRY